MNQEMNQVETSELVQNLDKEIDHKLLNDETIIIHSDQGYLNENDRGNWELELSKDNDETTLDQIKELIQEKGFKTSIRYGEKSTGIPGINQESEENIVVEILPRIININRMDFQKSQGEYGEILAIDFDYDEDKIQKIKSLDWDKTHRKFNNNLIGSGGVWTIDLSKESFKEFENIFGIDLGQYFDPEEEETDTDTETETETDDDDGLNLEIKKFEGEYGSKLGLSFDFDFEIKEKINKLNWNQHHQSWNKDEKRWEIDDSEESIKELKKIFGTEFENKYEKTMKKEE